MKKVAVIINLVILLVFCCTKITVNPCTDPQIRNEYFSEIQKNGMLKYDFECSRYYRISDTTEISHNDPMIPRITEALYNLKISSLSASKARYIALNHDRAKIIFSFTGDTLAKKIKNNEMLQMEDISFAVIDIIQLHGQYYMYTYEYGNDNIIYSEPLRPYSFSYIAVYSIENPESIIELQSGLPPTVTDSRYSSVIGAMQRNTHYIPLIISVIFYIVLTADIIVFTVVLVRKKQKDDIRKQKTAKLLFYLKKPLSVNMKRVAAVINILILILFCIKSIAVNPFVDTQRENITFGEIRQNEKLEYDITYIRPYVKNGEVFYCSEDFEKQVISLLDGVKMSSLSNEKARFICRNTKKMNVLYTFFGDLTGENADIKEKLNTDSYTTFSRIVIFESNDEYYMLASEHCYGDCISTEKLRPSSDSLLAVYSIENLSPLLENRSEEFEDIIDIGLLYLNIERQMNTSAHNLPKIINIALAIILFIDLLLILKAIFIKITSRQKNTQAV